MLFMLRPLRRRGMTVGKPTLRANGITATVEDYGDACVFRGLGLD